MKKVILFSFILLVAACKVGPHYKGTELTLPEAYRFSDTSTVPQEYRLNTDTLAVADGESYQWSALFQDAVLDSLVQRALRYNQDLAIAAENILIAQNALVVQRAAMLPQIGYQAGISRGNFQGLLLPDAQTQIFGAGLVNWELDFWGKFRRLNEAARANLLATEAGYAAARLSLTATVATAYFQLLEYQTRLNISRQTVNLRDSMLGIIRLRYEKGLIPEIDLNQAQIQLAIAQGQVPVWQRLLAQTEHQLSVLTGQVPQAMPQGLNLAEQDTAVHLPEGLPLAILTRRPDVWQAEQQLLAQNARVGVAQANRLPSISLSALLGTAGSSFDQLGAAGAAWNVGGSLLGPAFQFNRFKKLAEIEMNRRNQAQLFYEREVLAALAEVEDLLIAIGTLKAELRAREAHVKAALQAQMLSQNRYDQGVTSYLEYLESQRQAFDAQLAYAGSKQQLLSSYAALYKALGGGWQKPSP